MDAATWTFVILGAAIIAFISSRAPLAIVALGVALALWATGVLTLPEAFAGFGNPTVIFVASLFVVIEALQATGVTAWLAHLVVSRTGTSRVRLVLVIGLAAGVLGAFISVSGATGTLIPVVVVAAMRAGIVPSKMLIPLAFLASGGALMTLAASPVNIVVSEGAASAGGRPFGFFEFALVGIPVVVLTILIVLLLGDALLPERTATSFSLADPDAHARTLRKNYKVDLATKALFTAREGVAEVLIAPRSSLIGRDVAPGMRMTEEGLVVLALRRGDAVGVGPLAAEETTEALSLRAGDAVLVQGPWDALNRYVASPDVIAVAEPQAFQRAVPLGRGSKRALVIFGLMVVLLASGLVPTAVATMLAAGAMVLTGVVRIPDIYRSIPWTILILIGGLIALADAFSSTGAADIVADGMFALVGDAPPHVALLLICIVALVLGQFMSNLATVLVMMPVALAVAHAASLSPQPFMMGLAVACAASFLTPIATAGNLMVMQPGGYRFGDYWRLGMPLAIVYLMVAVLYVPLIWPF